MGNRYGRKQKRAHRAMIADQERFIASQSDRVRRLLADLSQMIDLNNALTVRFKDWDERIRSLLGPYTSAAINDTTFRVRDLAEIREMPVMPRLRTDFLNPTDIVSDSLAYYVEEILHIIASLEDEDQFNMSRHMLFEIQRNGYRDRAAIHGMSRTMFLQLMRQGDDGVREMARLIAPKIAQLLLTEPKERKRA